jgi:multidrug resistance protein, MATE family
MLARLPLEIIAPTVPPRSRRPTTRHLRQIAVLSTPIALSQLGQHAMNAVDMAIVGRWSVADLAGAGIGHSIGSLAIMIPYGITSALEPIAGQAVGAGDPARAWRGFVATLRVALLLWAPLILAGLAFTYLLPPFGVDAVVASRARVYLAGQAPGLAALLAFEAARTLLQAHGFASPFLGGIALANVANVVICALLVGGDQALLAIGLPAIGLPRMGALGGGIAYSVASLIVLAWVAIPTLRCRPSGSPAPLPTAEVHRLGWPSGLQLLAQAGGASLVAMIAATMGPTVAAAHQVVLSVTEVAYMVALGVSGATAVRVGNAVGAASSPRAVGMAGMVLTTAIMVALSLPLIVAPRAIAFLFTEDPFVIAVVADVLRIGALLQVVDGIQCVAAGALRGTGDVRFAARTTIAGQWLIGFPCSLLLAFALDGGPGGLWLGQVVGVVLVAALLYRRFARLATGVPVPV